MDLNDLLKDLRVDYIPQREFDGKTMNPNPIKQMERWFEDAFEAKIPELNAMVLSTVGLNGGVSSRVVLLKELTDKCLIFYTNYQSQKGEEMAVNASVAANFFLATTSATSSGYR